jgi:prepilin-type N-terminal cleavage/methylation domain-containing protein
MRTAAMIRTPQPNLRADVRRRAGFTLIEIMVVVVIILLMLGLALPVFRTITGARSEEGAANNVSAMLGRARADAVGLQKPIGVAFIYNPNNQLSYMAEVTFSPISPFVANTAYAANQCVSQTDATGAQYYFIATTGTTTATLQGSQTAQGAWQPVYGPPLDMVTDSELVKLPSGVAVQTVCNTTYQTNVRQTDGYLSVGVILFDSKGRLASMPYGISAISQLVKSAVSVNGIYPTQAYPSSANVAASATLGAGGYVPQFGVMSQFGVVLFQRDAFTGQNFSAADPAYTTPNFQMTQGITTTNQNSAYTAGSPSQAAEELWLDQNSTPLLIDRYTGELIKAE